MSLVALAIGRRWRRASANITSPVRASTTIVGRPLVSGGGSAARASERGRQRARAATRPRPWHRSRNSSSSLRSGSAGRARGPAPVAARPRTPVFSAISPEGVVELHAVEGRRRRRRSGVLGRRPARPASSLLRGRPPRPASLSVKPRMIIVRAARTLSNARRKRRARSRRRRRTRLIRRPQTGAATRARAAQLESTTAPRPPRAGLRRPRRPPGRHSPPRRRGVRDRTRGGDEPRGAGWGEKRRPRGPPRCRPGRRRPAAGRPCAASARAGGRATPGACGRDGAHEREPAVADMGGAHPVRPCARGARGSGLDRRLSWSRRARVRRADEHEAAVPAPPRLDQRLERVRPSRGCGERVRAEHRAIGPTGGVSPPAPALGAGRDRHVAALAVGEHEQAVIARDRDGALQRLPTGGAEALEAGELRA